MLLMSQRTMDFVAREVPLVKPFKVYQWSGVRIVLIVEMDAPALISRSRAWSMHDSCVPLSQGKLLKT